MTDKIRVRKCPWDPCVHRIDEDGDTVHMRPDVTYSDEHGFQGGKFGEIVAIIEVEQRTKTATVMDYCAEHGVLAETSHTHPCELLAAVHLINFECNIVSVSVEMENT